MDFTNMLLVVVLAVVQGVTEFLPISSSGHLVVCAALWASVEGKEFGELLGLSIVLHFGTLLAVFVFYRRRIARLVGEDRRVIGLLVVGSVPAAVVGVPLKLFAADLLEDPRLAGAMLLATGGMLLAAARLPRGDTPYQELRYRDALWIGVLQACAILPGISRSGATIVAGLHVGLRREAAATFSFLLAIPAIGGAALIELADLVSGEAPKTPWPVLALGAVLSCLVGLVALTWLVRWLERGRLHYFAYWCLPLGAAVLVWQFAF